MHVLDTLVLALQQRSPSSAGRAIWLFALLAVIAIAMIMVNRAIRRRLYGEAKAAARHAKSRRRKDPWAEAGRRLPLETDPDVPREPPDDPPPQRGFHERR